MRALTWLGAEAIKIHKNGGITVKSRVSPSDPQGFWGEDKQMDMDVRSTEMSLCSFSRIYNLANSYCEF